DRGEPTLARRGLRMLRTGERGARGESGIRDDRGARDDERGKGSGRGTGGNRSTGVTRLARGPRTGDARDRNGTARNGTAKSGSARSGSGDAATATARKRSRTGRAVLGLIVVAGLVGTAVLGQQYREAEQTREASGEALSAAREIAPVILSYDHRHLDRDFEAAGKHLTGSFSEEYGRTTSKVVAPTAKQYKGSVKATLAKPASGGKDAAASVVSAEPDKVVVLLFMNQVTKSSQISGPRLDLNRVRMTLVRTSGGWKASAVDAL
ncbi:MAG TPA: hypothetical protein DEQ61_20330, partial [Streptomyces sp.]|nr:hypothetical protein [Streptomyces sp.]